MREIRNIAPTARLLPAYVPSLAESIIAELHPYAFDVAWEEVDPALVEACHAKGIRVFCDLLGKDDRMSNYRKAIRFGVDVIQTDDVQRVRDLIRHVKK